MKKAICIILIVAMIGISAMAFCGCGNYAFNDGFKNEFYYVLLYEQNGDVILHTIDKWADSDSESLTISTKCCHNYIWVSSNNATLYRNEPKHLSSNYKVCG